MKKISLFLFLLVGLCQTIVAQEKKQLNHDVYESWNSIKETDINPNNLIKYRVQPGKGDPTLNLISPEGENLGSFERGMNGIFSGEEHFVFSIKPQEDSVLNMKRRKVDEKELPKDSLGIYHITGRKLSKISDILNFSMPKEWSGWLVYELEDSTSEDNFNLVIRELSSGHQDTVNHATAYTFSKFDQSLIYHTEGDSLNPGGVFIYRTAEKQSTMIYRKKGKYKNLSLGEMGKQAAFMIDPDTAKHLIPTYELAYWNSAMDSAEIILKPGDGFLGENILNEYDSVFFETSGRNLFFSTSPKPILQDTMLLEEEIPSVEVWSYTDGRLHTQQNIDAEKDKKKGYLSLYSIEDKNFVALNDMQIPDILMPSTGIHTYLVGYSNLPYQQYVSWDGYPLRYDVYSIDLNGTQKQIAENVVTSGINISPSGKFAFWSNEADTTWTLYDLEKGKSQTFGTSTTMFADELNDEPNHPASYGFAGWTKDDEHFLVYDRYDIWMIHGESGNIRQLTGGREKQKIYRYSKTHPKDKYINPDSKLILLTRDEKTEERGIALLELDDKRGAKQVIEGKNRYRYYRDMEDHLLVTEENFIQFPDLQTLSKKKGKLQRLTQVNPQQSEYWWGTSELFEWTDYDGNKKKGILVKPENFDPKKKYPLLVNFYERNAHNVFNHRRPTPGRSTINYSFYASRGYLIFNPDVSYETGYPGESCYNSVMSGVEALQKLGFVDEKKMGLQGHSWGGYQVAYLVTKTDKFAAVESGAPVPNMTSAYGGIRWWTGLSRMFQYEHTQSRLGASLWENRDLYIENSPLFFLDKVSTPMLIMHNDEDGHVPWYQGIEMFVAMRRLQKPAWMLNYSGEPHWPLEWKNRVDFNIRMQQFFDHYLKDEPMPKWMSEGIPAVEKGINLKYELENGDK